MCTHCNVVLLAIKYIVENKYMDDKMRRNVLVSMQREARKGNAGEMRGGMQ